MLPTHARRAVCEAAVLAAMLMPTRRASAENMFPEMLPQAATRLGAFAVRPKPRVVPRRRIDQDFAVLLMRTSYRVADELDFVPMDAFQKDFFLLRQTEWDPYRKQLPKVTQGDLADPNYFDFISFAQYATIGADMRRGRPIFEELVGAEGTTTLVTRASADEYGALPRDNAALPAAHADRVGNIILNWLDERYPNLAPKAAPEPTASTILPALTQLLNFFEINDYVLTYRLAPTEDGFEIALVAPATLWSQRTLASRGDPPNDFEAKVVQAYLRRCSVSATYKTAYSQSEVVHNFKWPPGFLPKL